MRKSSPRNLAVLREAHRALAAATTVGEVKELRDKAEAARKYAECAKLGLEKQNQCAEFKLKCERKAGRLLIELGIGPGRPGKEKWSHHATILADLGINKSQSSRWQMEAKVPDELLQLYMATAREKRREITALGLLRLAKQQREVATLDGSGVVQAKRPRKAARAYSVSPPPLGGDYRVLDAAIELVVELLNHHGLLSDNLLDFFQQEVVRTELVQRRTVARVLNESRESLLTLLGMLQAVGKTVKNAT
jgi:hypothetical protein